MEIRTYEQVDAAQVLALNMSVLGFPLTPALADALRKHDHRYHPFLAFYAVEGGQVAGQAGLLTSTVNTTEGPMKCGAAWAVCTLPQFGRQGIARTLMEQVAQTAAELGCQAITLGTNRTRVAHRLYLNLGYTDLLPIVQAFDVSGPRQPRSGRITVRRAAQPDLPVLEERFAAATAGKLGFTLRPAGFLRAAVQTDLDPNEIHGVCSSGRPVGYILARKAGDFLHVRCPVLPPNVTLTAVVDHLRALYPTPYLVVEQLTSRAQMRALELAGYRLQDSWGTFMLKPLAPRCDCRALFGLADGRFYVDPLDIT